MKKISQQTRKSSRLKKWLILTSRILLYTGLIFAFSEPYFPSKNSQINNTENWIYLDNSISVNSKGKRGDLLQNFSQDLIENLNNESRISLITNNNIYRDLTISELNSSLRNIEYSSKSLHLDEIFLKLDSENTNKSINSINLSLLSDFQNFNKSKFTDVNRFFSLVSLQPEVQNNISIDSLRVKEQTSKLITLEVSVTNHGNQQNTLPFSIIINQKLNNKKSISLQKNESKNIEFSFQKSPYILGEIQLDFQDTFLFDNRFYFTLDFRSKIKVLSIGKKANYLSKIFLTSEFDFTESSVANINYNEIPNQQFIILNEVGNMSSSLKNVLNRFLENKGSLLIIPSNEMNINSYNQFFQNFRVGKIVKSANDSLLITKIAFSHPVFNDVFSKKVQNFEYPTLYQRYIGTFEGNPILSYSNNDHFLEEINTKNGKIFWFSGSISPTNSNFTRSPLIVPTLYNLAFQSADIAKPYYYTGSPFEVTIPYKLTQDQILKITRDQNEFIPLQRNRFNSVNLSLSENMNKSGFYGVIKGNDTIQHIALNNNPLESNHNYLDLNSLERDNEKVTILGSVDELLQEIEEKNKVQTLWKLFLTLAIVSLCFEILILKFFKT